MNPKGQWSGRWLCQEKAWPDPSALAWSSSASCSWMTSAQMTTGPAQHVGEMYKAHVGQLKGLSVTRLEELLTDPLQFSVGDIHLIRPSGGTVTLLLADCVHL